VKGPIEVATPTKYVREYSFSGYQSTNPKQPLPGPRVDDELTRIQQATGSLVDAMEDIRRSDGKLQNESVTYESLSSDLRKGAIVRVEDGVAEFVNRAAVVSTEIADQQFVRISGYATSGDGGGAQYRRLSSAPSGVKAWHIQSADGAWWALAEPAVNVLMFGANPAKTAAQNKTAFQAACEFARDAGIDVFVPAGDYEIDPITIENIRVFGAGSQDVGYNPGTPSIDDKGRGGTQLRIRNTTTPAVSLRWGATLEGVTFYYPEQTKANFDANGFAPKVYPPTIFVDAHMVNVRIRSIGMVNSYIGIRIGDASLDGNASGRVYIDGLLGYCIKTGFDIWEAKDIVQISNSILSFAHFDPAEAGHIVIPNTFANWTYKNGAMVRVDSCDGLFIDNSFCFAYRKGIEVWSSNPNAVITGTPGLVQFMLVSNTLFDATAQALHVADGGWVTTTAFSNCIFTNLDASVLNNSGTYPSQIQIDSTRNEPGRLVIDGCYFHGAPGRHITIGNNSLDRLIVSDCDFLASHRAAGSTGEAGAAAMVYLANGFTDLVASFADCNFEASSSEGAIYAIAAEAAGTVAINGGYMGNFTTPVYANALQALTVNGLTTSGTTGNYSVAFGSSFSGRLAIAGNFDKQPQKLAIRRPYVSTSSFPANITANTAGAVMVFSGEALDATGAFNPATGTFTCQSDGLYRVRIKISGSVTAADNWRFDLLVNDVVARSVLVPIAVTGFQTLPAIEMEAIAQAGQTLKIKGSRFAGTGTFAVTTDGTLNQATFELIA
jgi:hypothetical protein